jgi:Protein of unknown function (DUF3995)
MIPALFNSVILLAISGIHVYWAFGGRWGAAVAIPDVPSLKGVKAFVPGTLPTLTVAVGLAAMAGLHLHKIGWLPISTLPDWLARYGLLAVGGIFFLRVIGDFRYVGFFKRVTDTPFARMDTALYIPLCLVISICAFWTGVK